MNFCSVKQVVQFILAGNAKVTIRSKITSTRFTFRIRQPKDNSPHFVSVLVGSDSQSDYIFLGSIFHSKEWRHGKRSTINAAAPSAKAFVWIWNQLIRDVIPQSAEIFHEGTCGRCGRLLTVPESIQSGIGPECAKKMGMI